MSKTICNNNNCQIQQEEFNIIELKCKKQKHINEDECLKNLIQNDLNILNKNNISICSIINYFDKIMMHLDNTELELNINKEYTEIINKVFSNFNTKGWCRWSICIKKIFNDNLSIVEIEWGGAETCPFKSEELDHEYRGYEYGSRDFIFIKDNYEYLHISSLLIHQIKHHNFFQGLQSKYRVSPEQIVKFFNLQSDYNYETEYIDNKYLQWYSGSSQSHAPCKDEDILEKLTFNNYEIIKFKNTYDENITTMLHVLSPTKEIIKYDGAIISKFYFSELTCKTMSYISLNRKDLIVKKILTNNEIISKWI